MECVGAKTLSPWARLTNKAAACLSRTSQTVEVMDVLEKPEVAGAEVWVFYARAAGCPSGATLIVPPCVLAFNEGKYKL